MAHFVELDENNVVIRGLVVPDSEEHRGQEYLAEDIGLAGRWLQTSYNGRIRYNYAGVGFTYDPIDDAFIPPMPCKHDSLILTSNKQWDCAKCNSNLLEATP